MDDAYVKHHQYHERMQETARVTDEYIFAALERYRRIPELYATVAELPLKRKGSSKVRAYFARSAYEILFNHRHFQFGQESKAHQSLERLSQTVWGPFAAAVELELCSMYYVNQFYDDKCDADPEGMKRKVMASHITRNLAINIVREQLSNAPHLDTLTYLLADARGFFAEGQFLDTNVNIYRQSSHLGYNGMMDNCDARMHGITGRYFETTGEMATLLTPNISLDEHEALTRFGKHYGILSQIVNDISEFVPTSQGLATTEKRPEDMYSDMRHGKLTYPVIHTLHHGSPEEREKVISVLETGKLPEEEMTDMTRMLMRNGAIDFAKGKAKEHAKAAKRALRTAFSKDERRYLGTMCVIAENNKYYKALERYRG